MYTNGLTPEQAKTQASLILQSLKASNEQRGLEPFRVCLSCGIEPRLRIDKRVQPCKLIFVCPDCGYRASSSTNLNAAITAWSIHNIPEASKAALWVVHYESLFNQEDDNGEHFINRVREDFNQRFTQQA